LAACGPNTAEHERVVAESRLLRQQIDSLNAVVDELRNGATRRFGEATAAFSRQQYQLVIDVAASLDSVHPGSPEARQASALAQRARGEIERAKRLAEEAAVRERAAREKTARDKVRDVIRVSRVHTSSPNSAGGVDLRITWQNRSSKVIKYAWFTVEAFNAVGDPVACTIRDYTRYTGKVTGPISAGSWYGDNSVWENAWYNHSIVRGRLREIAIEYMDGTTVELSGADLDYARY
jgi:hypothetical protein